jgi:uncharacterized OsmC-like protein
LSERNFSMRMRSTYEGDNNAVASLDVEHQLEGRWQPFEIGLGAPGFDIFVYAVLACQHLYFRANCAERGLMLGSAEGTIRISADADWKMETLQVQFSGRLASGRAGQDDIDYIVARMEQCPVSRNLRQVPEAGTVVTLE